MAAWFIAAGAAGLFIVGIVARAARRAGVASRGSTVCAAVWTALLAMWSAYGACGLVQCGAPALGPLASFALSLAAASALVAPGLRWRISAAPALAMRAVLLALCVPLAVFLLEWPYNPRLFQMGGDAALLNLALVGGGLACVWFVCQRRRAGALGYLAACYTFGLANYFLCLFKEQTVLPADVLALSTAAEVSAGYTYVLSDGPVLALILLVLMAALFAPVPSPRLTRRGIAANLVLGLAVAALLVNWYETHDLKEDYGVTVDVWSTRDSYMAFGSVPGFLQRMQEVEPEEPDGYTSQDAAELRSALAAAWDADHPGYPQTLAEARSYQEDLTGSDELPCVVAIMNESFSDLSAYPGIDGYEGTDLFDGIDAQLRGLVYTSARGGGTCNSEFEYLTGSTLGALGGGVYPYMFYDLSGVEALPAYFASLGYGTSAVHPAEATNWRRDVVYQQLGFDRFVSEDDFADDADTLRGMITDAETYAMVLDLLGDGGDTPQFVFDVTLQNHGGYATGLLDDYPYDGVTVNGRTVDELSEYLSCIDAAEEDLVAFLEELAGLDRKVIVVFFGDHQPGFNDELSEAAWGTPVSEQTLDQVQQRFATPYIIWANYDLGLGDLGLAADEGQVETSLGYLMATTVYAAGLPLTDYQKALLQLRGEMPAANLNGYRDADGTWYWNGQDSLAKAAWDAYATLQYANLFDAAARG